jgi:hypothetical protein
MLKVNISKVDFLKSSIEVRNDVGFIPNDILSTTSST